MPAVETLEETVDSFIVPVEVRNDYASGEIDLNRLLKEEGISLDEAVDVISSEPKSQVAWEDGYAGKGFYFHYTYHVKQRDGSYLPVKHKREATGLEIISALHTIQDKRIDRRKTWLDKTIGYLREHSDSFKAIVLIGGMVGALAMGVRFGWSQDRKKDFESTPESYKAQDTVLIESMLEKDESLAETYTGDMPDLVERASAETGINENVFRAMVAFGNSDDSKSLREKGYKGLIPVNPVAAGAAPRLLETDDYFSLLAFADQYKKIRQNTVDDETALAVYLTSEEAIIDAKHTANQAKSTLDGWDTWVEENKGEALRIKRILDILECARSEAEPDESLFEPVLYKTDKGNSRGFTEKDLRGMFKSYRETYLEVRDHSDSHYNHIKTKYGGLSHDDPEHNKERQKFIAQSVWFTNLPEYASKVIARVHGGSE